MDARSVACIKHTFIHTLDASPSIFPSIPLPSQEEKIMQATEDNASTAMALCVTMGAYVMHVDLRHYYCSESILIMMSYHPWCQRRWSFPPSSPHFPPCMKARTYLRRTPWSNRTMSSQYIAVTFSFCMTCPEYYTRPNGSFLCAGGRTSWRFGSFERLLKIKILAVFHVRVHVKHEPYFP